jgi:MATE family multidrug resistance protein
VNHLSKKVALKELLLFSLPIIAGHLGIMLIGTGDMMIAGRYSRECLAAIGLAISISNPVMMLALGVQFAISPLLAQRRGRGEDISDYFWTTMALSLFVGTIATILTYLSVNVLPYLGYSENLNVIIREYIIILAPSMIVLCLYQGVKEFFQAQERTIWPNVIALVAAGLNVALNYAFVFGEWGFPELQEPGLAWASLTLRTFMGGSLFLVAMGAWKTKFTINTPFCKEVFAIGLPISISIFFEVMAFCSVTLFIGKFAEIQTAANNIALNFASLAFMVPMSIASAVGVKVGHAYGEKNVHNVRTFSVVSLFAAVTFTAFMGLITFNFPGAILSAYSGDHEVLHWGIKLLFWVACFQIFDGAQVTLAGILRGLSLTRISSLGIFIGYWIIGIPLGYYLGFHRGLEAQGFWMGLALSLALVAIMLGWILYRKMKTLEHTVF